MFELNSQTPFQLRNEARSINVTTKREGNSITITWNIPLPLNGAASSFRAYDGVVILGSTTAFSNNLINHTKYEADPTMSPSLHAGDKIDTLQVLGAFYSDTTTNSLIVTDCDPQQCYYFRLYPVSKNCVYDDIGVASYELQYEHADDLYKATYGTQKFTLSGKSITDNIVYYGTPPTTPYTLKINREGTTYDVSIDPLIVLTYDDLITSINNFFKIDTSDFISPTPLNMNTLWFTNTNLYLWDGYDFIPQTVYVQTTQPHTQIIGNYWLNGTNLSEWNGSNWTAANYLSYNKHPDEVTSSAVWYDGSNAYEWNGAYWLPSTLIQQADDPSLPPFIDGTYWYNYVGLFYITNNKITNATAVISDIDPTTPTSGDFWLNLKTKELQQWNGTVWVPKTVTVGKGCDMATITTQFYYDLTTQQLFDVILDTEISNFVVWSTDPMLLGDGALWFDGTDLFIRLNNAWNSMLLITSDINPTLAPTLQYGLLWLDTDNNNMYRWLGNTWEQIEYISNATDPFVFIDNTTLWYDTLAQKLYLKVLSGWQEQTNLVISTTDPSIPVVGEFWKNGATLSVWNGIAYTPVLYTTSNPSPAINFIWYDTTLNKLRKWNGVSYVDIPPNVEATWDQGILFTDTSLGSSSYVCLIEYRPLEGVLEDPLLGNDAVSRTPMQYEKDVGGDDGSNDERLYVVDSIKRRLGYPIHVVELTDQQVNDAVDRAIRVLRSRSSVAYNRMVMLMEMKKNMGRYILSNRRLGYHKIADIMQIYRLPSSFLTAVGSQQIYGQLVLQQLYQAGTFDLVSYHLISSYIELLEKMFAAKITFNWRERTRELVVYNTTGRDEIVLLDCVVERTENDLLSDRRLQDWIERYALSECREMLADIRGKFASLPGPGGGISLNASDMRESARQEKEQCIKELETYVVEQPEEFGGYSTVIMG